MDNLEVEKANSTKRTLNQVSSTFCTVKWKHATINFAAGSVKSCCHSPFRKFSQENIQQGFELHDTLEDRQERSQMLAGERPAVCSDCWRVEDQGHLSDRIVWSSKQFMTSFTQKIAEQKSDKAASPSWLELNFSNVCNLKCSYCSPIYSTKWLQEIKEFGPYQTSTEHNDLKFLQSVDFDEKFNADQLVEVFWPWFEKIYSGPMLLKLTGGEPLLSPHTEKLMDYLIAHPHPELSFSINSNLSVPDEQWSRFMNKLSQMKATNVIHDFYLHPSIDSFGARAEYIRHGLNFERFQKNVESYLEHGFGHLVFICSLNNLSLGGLLDFWRYLYSLKQKYAPLGRWVSITTEIVHSPEWQNINILPSSYKKYLQETIAWVESRMGPSTSEFSEFEVLSLKRALEMMDLIPQDLSLRRKNFYSFFSEHDRRRGTDFRKIFPELFDFYEGCHALKDSENPQLSKKSLDITFCNPSNMNQTLEIRYSIVETAAAKKFTETLAVFKINDLFPSLKPTDLKIEQQTSAGKVVVAIFNREWGTLRGLTDMQIMNIASRFEKVKSFKIVDLAEALPLKSKFLSLFSDQ